MKNKIAIVLSFLFLVTFVHLQTISPTADTELKYNKSDTVVTVDTVSKDDTINKDDTSKINPDINPNPGINSNPGINPVEDVIPGVENKGREKDESLSISTSNISDNLLADELVNLDISDVAQAITTLKNNRIVDCLTPQLKSEILSLYTKFRDARLKRNDSEMAVIRKDFEQLREKIRESIARCRIDTGNTVEVQNKALNQEMRSVISSYVAQIQNLTDIADVREREILRKRIKQETMTQVKAIIAERKEANAADIAQIAKIKVVPNKIKIDEEEINGTDVALLAKIQNRVMNISSVGDKLFIREDDLNVSVPSLEISENGTIIVSNAIVKVTPKQIQEKVKSKIKAMEIKSENNQLIYQTVGDEDRKLFGLFPLKIQSKAKISAETGQILSEEKPWWAFLTTE